MLKPPLKGRSELLNDHVQAHSPPDLRVPEDDNVNPLTLPSNLTINHHRIVHELITHPVTPLPHLAFKNASL